MQQALQYGQNGDFIRLWQVGHFVAFRVGMGHDKEARRIGGPFIFLSIALNNNKAVADYQLLRLDLYDIHA
ncbi:hypothetical protein [Symbiopectobacterium purcellii]|uniref:hypothetical protein n=1 Tax=Symbiopectobacterium purcellii TaxID=2871826 RepID=UPI003F85B2E1